MYKKIIAGIACLLTFAIITTMLAACSIHEANKASGPAVHMGNADFVQNSITIQKGQSVELIDDVAVVHIITNGTWKDGQADPFKENNAPVYDYTFNGNDSDALGPFNVSGTFHYYCTIHPGMKLMVIVK